MKIHAQQRLVASIGGYSALSVAEVGEDGNLVQPIESIGQGELVNARHRITAETIKEYIKRLKKLGIKALGNGSFADVFQHPTMPNVVVKLLTENDDGYEAYVKFCQQQKNNPYCPEILQVVEANQAFDRKGDYDMGHLRLIFMEKLQPAVDDDYVDFANHCREVLAPGSKPFKGVEDAGNYVDSTSTWHQLSQSKKDTKLAALAKFIIATEGKNGVQLDLHESNIMMRGNQVVVTDPFATY